MNYVTRSFIFADVSFFSPEISKFCYIKKYRYRFHFDASVLFILSYFDPLNTVLINMVTTFMMSAKMATQAFLKCKFFKIKVMKSFFFVFGVTDKLSSRDSNYDVIAVMWPELDNSNISIREVLIISVLIL